MFGALQTFYNNNNNNNNNNNFISIAHAALQCVKENKNNLHRVYNELY